MGADGIRASVGHPVHDDVETLARLVTPRREHRRHRAQDRAARPGDRAGDDPSDREGVGAEGVDLEDRPAEPALEMPAHLVEHGVHAVTVDRHRHAVGCVGHADRCVGREPDADGLPAAVEAAHVPGVHVDEKVGLGDAPVHDHRITVLRRPSEIDEAVRVLRVVARAAPELAHERAPMIRASSAGRSFRWSALAQMSETCPRATPAAASSPSTASMAIVRIGPYRAPSRHRTRSSPVSATSPARRDVAGRSVCANASPTAVVRSLTGVRDDRFAVREHARALGERRGQGGLAVGQIDVHDVEIPRSGSRLTDCRRSGGTRPRRARPS